MAYAKTLVFLGSLFPVWYLLHLGLSGGLGANPIEKLTHTTGEWALRFLLITLAVTPLAKLSGKAVLIRFRRMLGLFAFFYALLHFFCYLVLDHFFHWQTIVEDIYKRPYITVGFAALVLLFPLALTSTARMMRRLGRNWKRLHRLVYPIAFLGILHFLWLVKADLREPLIYLAIFALLLILRLKGVVKRPLWSARRT